MRKAEVQDIPRELDIEVARRWPTTLPGETVEAALQLPVPHWPENAALSASSVDSFPARASIVVVTLDNPVFTRLCLHSIFTNTPRNGLEIVIVDNGSRAPLRSWLDQVSDANPDHVRLLRNKHNAGFAGAANQGMAVTTEDIIILLNNDTLVTPGWLAELLRPLESERVGMVSPATNRSGNEAEVPTRYRTYGDLLEFAAKRRTSRHSQLIPLSMISMFCVAFRREVLRTVGPLDERFGEGLFEDDDYSCRVRRAGYSLLCADSSFVHHFGQATFGILGGAEFYAERFQSNRSLFEKKWLGSWVSRQRLADPDYEELQQELASAVKRLLPTKAQGLIVSRGDDRIRDRVGLGFDHFPSDSEGVYLGYYPADSRQAISWLDESRSKGKQFLIFPATSTWWLEHYCGLRRYLEEWAELKADVPGVGVIYRLKNWEEPRA